MAQRPEAEQPGNTDVYAQLERIEASQAFSRSKRMQAFLRYVVEEALAGRGEGLKAATVAADVFGREPAQNPDSETLVRVEARRLRQKLEQFYDGEGREDPVIVELPKGGYLPRFRARNGAPCAPRSAGAADAASGRIASASDPTRRRRWPAFAGAVLLVALVFAAFGPWQAGPPSVAPAAGPGHVPTFARIGEIAPGLPSIAVMPFEAFTEQAELIAPGHGLADEIISGLTRFPRLLVVAWDTVEHVHAHRLDPDLLGVRYLLDGTIREADGTLRVAAQLTDLTTHKTVWAGSYDEALSARDLFAIEDEISERIIFHIARAFELELNHRGLTFAKPESFEESIESYECLLRAKAYSRRLEPGEHAEVRACLEQSVERDPDFGKAWAALAFAYLDEVRYGFNPRPELYGALMRAADSADRAHRLAPQSVIALRALFTVHFMSGNLEAFRVAGERALALAPNDSDLLADFGLKLAFSGDWDQGLGHLERAIAFNPAHPDWYFFPRVYDAYRKRDYETALAHATLIELPSYPPTHFALAVVYGQLGRQDEAGAALDRLVELIPDFPLRPRAYLAQWRFEAPLVEHFMEGLTKAGMPRPPDA